jgi:hypothetical protein
MNPPRQFPNLTREKLAALLKLDARAHGHAKRHWTVEAIAQYLERHEDCSISAATVRDHLQANGFVCEHGAWHLSARARPQTQTRRESLPYPQTDPQRLAERVRLPPGLARTPLFPALTTLNTLQALHAAGGELRRGELKKRVQIPSANRTLRELHATRLIDAPTYAGDYQADDMHVQLLLPGARLLKLLEPHIPLLYPKQAVHPVMERASIEVLFALAAHPGGLYPKGIRQVLGNAQPVDQVQQKCYRLLELDLLARHTLRDRQRSSDKKAFYQLNSRGRALSKALAALFADA